MRNKITLKKIKGIAWGVSLVFVIGVIVFMVRRHDEYKEALRNYQYGEEEYTALEHKVQNMKKLLKNNDRERKEIDGLFINEKELPLFLDDITKIAEKSYINITNIGISTFKRVSNIEMSESSPALFLMPINMGIQGEFVSIVDFFARLESYKQAISLSKVRIQGGRSSYPMVSCNFILTIYSRHY